MEMTNERAAEILNPAHYEDHDSLETVQEACRMGQEALLPTVEPSTRWGKNCGQNA